MSSSPPPTKSFTLQLAQRIHNTTGKETLPFICIGGFVLESLWHSVVERKVFKTPAPAIKKAMLRSTTTWPAVFIVTSASISWAAWKVDQEPRDEGK